MAERNAPSLKTEWLKDAMKDINDLITQALSMDLQKEASSAVSSGLPKGIQQGIKKAKTTTVDLDQLIEVKMGKQNEIEKEVEEYTRILEKKTAHQQIEIPAEIVPVINKKIRTLSGDITKGIKGIDEKLAKPHSADLKRKQDAFDKQIEKDPEEYKGTVFEAYNRLAKVIEGLRNADDKFLTLSDKIDEQTIKSNMDTIIDIVTLIGELSSYTKQFKDLNLPEISDAISVTGLQDYIQDFMDNFMSFPKNHPIRKKIEAAYDTGRSYGVYDIQDALYGKDVDTKIPKLLEKKLKELHKIKEEVAELEIQKIEQSLSGKITIKDLERAENALDELLEKYGDTKLESTEGFDKQVDKILDLQGKIIDTKEKLLALPQVSAASSQQSEQRVTELKEEKKQAEETAEAESELLKITTDLISIGSKEHKKKDFHERVYGFNEDTGFVSEVVQGDAKEVTGDITNELFKRIAHQIKSALHTHDSDIAAIDSSDLRIFAQELDEFGIINQYVLGFKEIQKIDLSKLSSEDVLKVANEMDNLFTKMASEWREISNASEAVDAGRDVDKIIERAQNAVREYIGDYLGYLSSDSLETVFKITDAEVKNVITKSDYTEIDFSKIVSGIFSHIAKKISSDTSSGLEEDEIIDDLNNIQTDIIDIISTNIQKLIFGKDIAIEGKKSADKVQRLQQQALQSVLTSMGHGDALQTQKFVGKNIDKRKVLGSILGDKGSLLVDAARESEQALDEIGDAATDTGQRVNRSLNQITESAEEAHEALTQLQEDEEKIGQKSNENNLSLGSEDVKKEINNTIEDMSKLQIAIKDALGSQYAVDSSTNPLISFIREVKENSLSIDDALERVRELKKFYDLANQNTPNEFLSNQKGMAKQEEMFDAITKGSKTAEDAYKDFISEFKNGSEYLGNEGKLTTIVSDSLGKLSGDYRRLQGVIADTSESTNSFEKAINQEAQHSLKILEQFFKEKNAIYDANTGIWKQRSNETPDSSITEELEKEAYQAHETAEEYQKLNDIRNDSQDTTSNEKITPYTEEEIKSVKEMAEAVRNVGKAVTEDKIPPFKEEAVEVGKAIDEELNWIERLRKAISQGIPVAIDEKNDAFREELAIVAEVIETERGYLLGISTLLDEIASKARIDFKFNNNADSLEVADQAGNLNSFVKTVLEWIKANDIQVKNGTSTEKGMYANLDTGYSPNTHISGNYGEFPSELMRYLLIQTKEILNAFFHTHPDKFAAPSDADISAYATDKRNNSIDKQFIIGTSQIAKISLDSLTAEEIDDLAVSYMNKIFKEIYNLIDSNILSVRNYDMDYLEYSSPVAGFVQSKLISLIPKNTGEFPDQQYEELYNNVIEFTEDAITSMFKNVLNQLENGNNIDSEVIRNEVDELLEKIFSNDIPVGAPIELRGEIADEVLDHVRFYLSKLVDEQYGDNSPLQDYQLFIQDVFKKTLTEKGFNQSIFQTFDFDNPDSINLNELRQFLEIKQSSLDASNNELQTWENIRSIILSLKDDLQELLRLKSNLYSSLGYFDDSVSNENLIDNIGSRLKELYQLRNENGFEDQFGNEIVVLKELLDSLNSSVADATGNKNIAKYFDNTNRFIEAQERLNRLNNSGASVLTGFTNEEMSDVQNMIGAIDKLINELREAKGLISSTFQKDLDNTSIPSSISPEEYENLTKIQNILVEICDAIGIKNNAFLEEQNIVSSVVGSEHNDLTTLLSDLDKMSSIIDSIILAFKNINIGNNINVDWIKKFSNLKNIDFKTITSGLTSLYNGIKKVNLKDNSFLKDISNILDKGKELESLAKIVSQNQSKIDKVKEASSSKNKSDIKSNYDKELNARKEILKLQHEINIAEAKGAENADEIKARNEAMVDVYQAQIKEAKKLQQGNTNKNERNRIEKELRNIERRYKAEEEGERKVSEIKRAKTEQDRIEKENAKAYNDAISERESLWNNLVDTIDKYQKKLNKNINEANVSKDLKQEWAGFYNQLQELGSQLGNEFNISLDTSEAQKRIAELTEDVDKSLTQNSKKAEKLVNENSVSKFYTKIADFKQRNTKLGKELTIELDQIINETRALMNGSVTGDALERKLKDLDTQFNKITASAKEAGEVGKSFGQKIKDSLTSANARFLANYLSFQDFIRYIRSIAITIKEVDSALTELRKVSDASSLRLQQNFQKSAETAKELGSSITSVINQTADWSRLGYGIDDAEKLARVTTLFQTVGDNMSTESASEVMISTLKAYSMGVDEAERIVDRYNEVANNFAIDTAGLGNAITRSGAALHAAGNELSESMALIVAANDSLQDPDSVGQMLKTMSMRLRGASVAELEELGIDTTGMTQSKKSIVQQYKAQAGINIMEGTNYKSTFQILDELHDKWDQLTDVERAAITEATGGKRGGSVMSSLMENWEDAREVVEKAESSEGSAMKEQENYARSIQFSLDRLNASWQELQADFLNSSVVKGVIDFGNTIINILDSIVEHPLFQESFIPAIIGILAEVKGIGPKGFIEWISEIRKEKKASNNPFEELKTYYENLRNSLTEPIEIQDVVSQNIDDNIEEVAQQAVDGAQELIEASREIQQSVVEGAADILETQRTGYKPLSQDEINEMIGYQENNDEYWDQVSESIHGVNQAQREYQESIEESSNELGDFMEDMYDANSMVDNLGDIMSGEDIPYDDHSEEIRAQAEALKEAEGARISDALAAEERAQAEAAAAAQAEADAAATQQATQAELQNAQASRASIAALNAKTAAEENSNLMLMQRVMSERQMSLADQQLMLQEGQRLAMETALNSAEAEAIMENAELSNVEIQRQLSELALKAGTQALTTETMRATAAELERRQALGQTLTIQEANLLQMYKNIDAMKNMQKQSKVFSKITGIFKSLGSMFIMSAISWGIGKLVEGIDNWIHKEEKAIEKAKEVQKQIDEVNNSLKNNIKSVGGIKDRYAELAQGVKNLGTAFQSQGTLSTDEYEEFLDLSNQLAELYPQLTIGYTDNRDAILGLTGSVNDIVGALDNLIDREKQLARLQIDDLMTEAWDGNKAQIKNFKEEIFGSGEDNAFITNEYGLEVLNPYHTNGNKDWLETYSKVYNYLESHPLSDLVTTNMLEALGIDGSFQDIIEKAGINVDEWEDAFYRDEVFNPENYTIFNEKNLERLKSQLAKEIQKYQNLVWESEDKIKQIDAQMRSNLDTYMSTDVVYAQMDDNQKLIARSIIQDFDFSKVQDEFDSWESLTDWVHNNIVNALAKVKDKDINDTIKDILSGAIKPENLDEAYSKLIKYFQDHGYDELVTYWTIQYEDLQKDRDDVTNKVFGSEYGDNFKYLPTYEQERIREQRKELDDWVNSLSKDELTLILNADTEPASKSLEDLNHWLYSLKYGADEVEESFSTISQSVKQFNDELKPQFDSLATAYQQIFYNDKGFKAGLESIDIAWFENIRSNFEDIKEELGITFDSTAVDAFFDALDDGSEITEKMAHDAFNELASAYFYSAEGLKNLNVETEKSIRLMMKNMGVVNADKVIDNLIALEEQLDYILDYSDGLEEEYAKIKEFGVSDYAEQIKDQTIQSKYGNIDMDKRTIIHWSDELKETWKHALDSWDYDPDVGGIDTVWGSFSDEFTIDNQSVDIAFTPIMVDQNGNNPEFLDKDTVSRYIQNVLNEADRAISESGEEWSEELVIAKALEIDASGQWTNIYDEAGKYAGTKFVHGLIGGINDSSGISALDVSSLLHFSGEEGAIQIIEKGMDEISAVEEQLVSEGKSLEEITQADIQRFMQLGIVTDASAEKLQYYAAMKAAASGTLLNEAQPISALSNLAIAAGMAKAEIEELNAVMEMFDRAAALEEQGAYQAANAIRSAAEARQRKFAELVQERFNEKFNFDLEVEFPNASDAGSKAGKDTVDAFQAELDNLQWLYDNDLIDTKTYLDQKRALIERMWKDGTLDAKAYFEKIHAWLREMLDLYNQVISDVTKILDKEIDKLNKERDARVKALEEERDAQLDAIDKELEALDKKIKKKQEEIDLMEKEHEKRKEVMDLMKAEYELQRSLNQRTNLVYKEGFANGGQLVYQADPKAVKDARENLEEKEYEKRLRVLQDELELLEKSRDTLNEQRSEIEKHYQTLIDETNKYYDDAIKRIEEYKEAWSELAEIEEQALMESRLASLGLSIEDILGLDMGAFETFKGLYLGLLNDIYGDSHGASEALYNTWGELPGYLDKTANAINSLNTLPLDNLDAAMQALGTGVQSIQDCNIDSMQGAIDGINTVKDAFNQTADSVKTVSDAVNGSGGAEGSSESSGSSGSGSGGSGGNLDSAISDMAKNAGDSLTGEGGLTSKFEDVAEYIVESVIPVINGDDNSLKKALEDVCKAPYEITVSVSAVGPDALLREMGFTGSSEEEGHTKPTFTVGPGLHYNGTVGAAFFDGYPGLNKAEQDAIRSEFGQPELTVYPNGTYEITTTPTISDLPKGTVIFNEEQTKRILKNNGKGGKAFEKGTSSSILPLKDAMPEKYAIMEQIQNALKDNLDKMTMDIADISSNVRDISANVTNVRSSASNTMTINGGINVTCPGVTEAEVAKNIGGALKEQLNGIFSGFALRADQLSMRR